MSDELDTDRVEAFDKDERGNPLVLCPKCNHYIALGDWPFCPHGRRGNFTNFRDEIPGGIVLENYGPKPMRFDSHSERRTFMAANGLSEIEKYCPFPGTDKDPMGIPNPAGYMDPYTLEQARILVSRQGEVKSDKVDGVIRGEFNITGTSRDAIAVQQGDTRRSSRIGRRIKAHATDEGS